MKKWFTLWQRKPPAVKAEGKVSFTGSVETRVIKAGEKTWKPQEIRRPSDGA